MCRLLVRVRLFWRELCRARERADRCKIDVYKPHPVDYMECYWDRGGVESSGELVPGKSKRLPKRGM